MPMADRATETRVGVKLRFGLGLNRRRHGARDYSEGSFLFRKSHISAFLIRKSFNLPFWHNQQCTKLVTGVLQG
jgi:hypothetical protein